MRMKLPIGLELCIRLAHSLDTDSYMAYIYMWNAKKMQIVFVSLYYILYKKAAHIFF